MPKDFTEASLQHMAQPQELASWPKLVRRLARALLDERGHNAFADDVNVVIEKGALSRVRVGSWWTHTKTGGRYKIIAVAQVEADPRFHHVIYRDIDGYIWSRPLVTWLEEVKVEGKLVPRFSLSSTQFSVEP